MPTRASTWRQRSLAVARKGYDAALLNEDLVQDESTNNVELKTASDTPSSPISVASTFELLPEKVASVASSFEVLPEMKPIALPDAWVTIGKNGKPLKNQKMYEEPEVVVDKKTKKKRRTRRAAEDVLPMVVAIDEASSSSKSLRAFDRSTAQRFKEVIRSRDAKHWAKYQRAKPEMRAELEALAAALSGDEAATDQSASGQPVKDNKANRDKDKARRRARSAASAARCFSLDPDEHVEEHVEEPVAKAEKPAARAAKSRGELELLLGSRATLADGMVWTTVGKGGKALSDFPPLKPPAEQGAKQRRKSGEGPPQKVAKHEKGLAKCVVM